MPERDDDPGSGGSRDAGPGEDDSFESTGSGDNDDFAPTGSGDPGSDGLVGRIDYDLLDRIGRRLRGSERFESVKYRPPYAPDSLVADYDPGYFPPAVDRAYLRIRWYTSDDFTVHYSEQYADGTTWDCRWDRHPSDHNARDHYHPPPDARTPGEDRSYPSDWRDVVAAVLVDVDDRIRSHWE